MKTEIKINLLEVASELAHDAAFDEMIINDDESEHFISDESEMFQPDGENEIYTEAAQEVFNRWYDHFYNKISELQIK